MTEDTIIIHRLTEQALQRLLSSNAHGLLLIGPKGIGKSCLSAHILDQRHTAGIDSPHILRLLPETGNSISIDAVRKIEHYVSRRIPTAAKRTILIEDASQLGHEAQNALLKMLEEPPHDTLFILTAESENAVLPTVRSRVSTVQVIRPDVTSIRDHFTNQGFTPAAIQRAELMSGGLPGLMHTLLTSDEDHPLFQAATMARQCVQSSSFERLSLVDSLVKNRQLCLDTLYMLQQMAHISIEAGKPAKPWQALLSESYAASQLLQQSAQPKLVLTNLMLNLTV